jgi:hypothetical protein
MLSKLVSQVVVFGTPLIMVCLFIAFIGLFIYFNRRIDRVVDRVNTLSELVSVLQDLVNTRQQVAPASVLPAPEPVKTQEENKVVHVAQSAGEKIVVSDDEDDYVSSSSEEDEEDEINLMIQDEEVEDEEPMITITKMEHSPEPESEMVVAAEETVETQPEPICNEFKIEEPCLIDDDIVSVVSMSVPTVIPEPILEEICTNAVLKEKFLSTNYRGYKVNQLRDLATELHLITDKDAAKLKKGELITFLDKTYVGLKN